jgi:hypothetical protein
MGNVAQTDSRGPSLNTRHRRLRQSPQEKRQTTRFLYSDTSKDWQGLGRQTQSGCKTSSTRFCLEKKQPHVLSFHHFWCVIYCFIYSQRNPGFLWSMWCVLQSRTARVELNPGTGRVGGNQMHRFSVISGLQQNTVFICLLSAGELHSTVVATQE